jgi:hypothetical protein
MPKTIRERLSWLEAKVDELFRDMGKTVSIKEFAPVKSIVYGMVSAILLSVVGAVIALVMKS